MPSKASAALDCLRRGWAVIPLKSTGEKAERTPYVNWRNYQQVMPTEEEVIHWWTEWPDADLAVVTGRISGLVVIDLDGEEGIAQFDNCIEQCPTLLVSQTGSGGYHLFYAYPDGEELIPNRVRFLPGMDCRADGGYVRIPPSGHYSGNTYKWIIDDIPGECTPELLESIKASGEAARKQTDEKWVSNLLRNGAPEGTRNDSLASLAGYYASKGIVKDAALELLLDWNYKNDPPLDALEVERTVASVFKKYWRDKLQAEKQQPVEQAALEAEYSNVKAAVFNTVSLEAFMSEYGDKSVEWIIDDWLPKNTMAFMVADPGSYKTWLMLDLLVSIASGTPFLGMYPVKHTGPTMLIQQEDHLGGIAQRLAVIIHSKFPMGIESVGIGAWNISLPPTIPLHIHTERALRFDNTDIMDSLEQTIYETRPVLVAIDPLYSAASGGNYMADDIPFMFRFKTMRDNYGTSFLFVHHTSKGNAKERKDKKEEGNPSRLEGWGSQFLNAFLETGWQLRPTKVDTEITIYRHFKVKANKKNMLLCFDIETEDRENYGYKVTAKEIEPEKGEEEDAETIYNYLMVYGAKNITQLSKELFLDRKKVVKKLAELEKQALVTKVGRHNYEALAMEDLSN